MSNLKELRAIYQAMTGKPSQANTSSEAIRELVDAHADEADYEITAVVMERGTTTGIGDGLLFPKEHLGETISSMTSDIMGAEVERVINLAENGHTNFSFRYIGVAYPDEQNNIVTRPFTEEESAAYPVMDAYGAMVMSMHEELFPGSFADGKEFACLAGVGEAQLQIAAMIVSSDLISTSMGTVISNKGKVPANIPSETVTRNNIIKGDSYAWDADKVHCTGTAQYTGYKDNDKLFMLLNTLNSAYSCGVLKLIDTVSADRLHAPRFINGKAVHILGSTATSDSVTLNFDFFTSTGTYTDPTHHYRFSSTYMLEAGSSDDPSTHDISLYQMNVEFTMKPYDSMAGIEMKVDTYRHKLV